MSAPTGEAQLVEMRRAGVSISIRDISAVNYDVVSHANNAISFTTRIDCHRFGKTPAEMREAANLKKGDIVEYRPPPPKGEPPKFQQRKDRLSFEFNR